jgi:hypothetical protein
MQRSQEYITIIGLFSLVGVCILLLSAPEDIFSSLMVIDVSKTQKTAYEMLVTTKFDFRKTDELKQLPENISGLESRDLNITGSEAKMGALLKRMYSDENSSILFLLLSSKNMTEFHNLEICYEGAWNITDKEVLDIKTEKLGEAGFQNIHVNKFIIQRGELEMVVLHWFMWDGGIVRSDRNFMLIQAGTSIDTTREDAEELTKQFTRDFFMKMYKPVQRSGSFGQQAIDRFGALGYVLVGLLILVPLIMIFNARIFHEREERKRK